MISDDVVEKLASLATFESVPRAELEWLRARGQERCYQPGETLLATGSAIDEMFIPLAGRVAVHVQKGGGSRKGFDAGPGYIFGAMPYSRMQFSPASLVSEAETILFELNRSHFPDLVRECPEL